MEQMSKAYAYCMIISLLCCSCHQSFQDVKASIAQHERVKFEEIALPRDTIIYDLAILENDHLWAIGYNGKDTDKIYYSTNGGRSWISKSINSKGMILNGLYFLDNQHGWAVGNSGIILTTKDGGMSWSELSTPTDYPLIKVHFFDAQMGYIVSRTEWGGEVFRTTNSGEKWEKVYSDLETGYVFDISILNPKTAAIAVNDAVVFTTRDGGSTWRKVDHNFAGAASVFYTVSGKLWVAGRHGGLYSSDDFGETWETPSRIPDLMKKADWISLVFDGEKRGAVVGRNGAVAITNDAGQTWSNVNPNTQVNLRLVKFRKGIAIAIGSDKAYKILN